MNESPFTDAERRELTGVYSSALGSLFDDTFKEIVEAESKMAQWRAQGGKFDERSPGRKVRDAVSGRIQYALRRGRGSTWWRQALGYSFEEFRAHLEGKFADGMSWANYGEWHIDHIRPLASFSIVSFKCADFRPAWALSNLQPLWALDNMRKGAKWEAACDAD